MWKISLQMRKAYSSAELWLGKGTKVTYVLLNQKRDSVPGAHIKVKGRWDYKGVGKQNRNKVFLFQEMFNMWYQLSAVYVTPKL